MSDVARELLILRENLARKLAKNAPDEVLASLRHEIDNLEAQAVETGIPAHTRNHSAVAGGAFNASIKIKEI